ncbi:hypothetical protein DC498_01250 [Terrimonas sp.]|uniref:hypothetical protein n=1 Tax=Terrimonas sp. TaxID=1914338 RepID=UPI000D50D963|nr:hypothetical protein [Terrimonas sp.]PVD54048.1 hypothetical protein DC498_01250 [Terrimonas sp.]
MAKFTTVLFVIIAIASIGCSETDNYKKPDDPLEAGRDFIRFALDGNMRQAKLFILKDGTNEMLFERNEKMYNASSKSEKDGYKEASIIINKSQDLNDSTTIISYSNSFKKENNQIKLVKQNNEWWVDFKYNFTGDSTNVIEK